MRTAATLAIVAIATAVSGPRGTVDTLPVPETLDILRRYGRLR